MTEKLDLDALEILCQGATGWNLSKAWPTEDAGIWQVGAEHSDGSMAEVVSIDTDNYFQPEAAEPLARFYAAANPGIVASLIARIRELEASAAMGQVPVWIPVMECEPMPGEEVLVAVEFDGPGDWRIKCGGMTEDRTWKIFGASWRPSHWMRLPAAPSATPPATGADKNRIDIDAIARNARGEFDESGGIYFRRKFWGIFCGDLRDAMRASKEGERNG